MPETDATKICLANFDASHCKYWVDTKKHTTKEEQVKVCIKTKCPMGSVTEKKVDGKWYRQITCDCSWSPFDNRPLTEEEKEDYR